MSRSKQHDRNRRIALAIGSTKGIGKEHPNAQFTRNYQAWRKTISSYERASFNEIERYHELARDRLTGGNRFPYASEAHYRATLFS